MCLDAFHFSRAKNEGFAYA